MTSDQARETTPPHSARAPLAAGRLRLELPWLLGVLLGWLELRLRGHAFVFMDFPAGHDWFEYLSDAWMAWHRVDLGFHAYRSALYPYLLGGLGEQLGYARAGLLISSLAMLGVVLAAGLGARALAGPWAGAVAAASLPLVNAYAESARVVNIYPALAAAYGLALALGACIARWPRGDLALAAGLMGGLAAGLDARGLTVWWVVALLGLAGGLHLPSPGRRIGFAACFLLASIPGPMAARAVALTPPMSAADHSIILRRDAMPMFRNRLELASVCADEPVGEPMSLAALTRPCARALLRFNARELDRFLPFGLWGSLALLVLALLPGRRNGERKSGRVSEENGAGNAEGNSERSGVGSWPAVVSSAAVLGWSVPMLLAPSLWVVLPERYFIPLAAPLFMLPPVGAARALSTLLPTRRAGMAALLAALLTGGWLARYGLEQPPLERLESHVLWAARGRMMERIAALVKPGDVLLDCSGMALEAGLLPRRFHVDPPSLSGVDRARCERWLELPEPPYPRSPSVERRSPPPALSGPPYPTPASPGLSRPDAHTAAAWIVTGVRCDESCHPVLVPREPRSCPHGLDVRLCPQCSFEARAGSRWEMVYESVKAPDRDGSLQLWRLRSTQ